MNHKKVLLASLLAASSIAATSAHAITNWVGTADYTQSAAHITSADNNVGLFDTYDEGAGVVLLQTTSTSGTTVNLNGYYQSYISQHLLAGSPVLAPNLDQTYELTVVANFTESTDTNTGAISINSGGTFGLYLGTKDRSFSADTGFNNGDLILSGTITGGGGSSINLGSVIVGVTNIDIAVTSFDHNVYSPDTISGGGGIFTLRLGSYLDSNLLGEVTNNAGTVQGHSVAGTGNYLFAADGYTALAVPEAHTYAMMLVGLGLVGFAVRRSRAV